MSSPSQPQGFLLLTLPSSTIAGPHINSNGLLSLQCVTLVVPSVDVTAKNDRDVWLVLRVGSYEMPISPVDEISFSRSKMTYTFTSSAGSEGAVVLQLPTPSASDRDLIQDLETFEVLVGQYGILREEDYPSEKSGVASKTDHQRKGAGDANGQVVLVDEEDGHILGGLGNEFTVKEDPSIHEVGREKDPVIVDLPDSDTGEAFVRSIDRAEEQGALKAAVILSRGVIYATNAITAGLSMATNTFVSRTTPVEKPVVFSERANQNVRRLHKVTGTAVQVSSKTVGTIHGLIDRVAGGKPKPASQPLARKGSPMPPPLPPRPGEKPTTPSYPEPGSSGLSTSIGPKKKPRLLNRLLLSTDLLLSTLEHSATQLLDHGTESLAKGLGHRYGSDMGQATSLIGRSVRNVGVVYIDARGVGRRALLKRAGKRVVKGMVGGHEVTFGGPEHAVPSPTGDSSGSHFVSTPSPNKETMPGSYVEK